MHTRRDTHRRTHTHVVPHRRNKSLTPGTNAYNTYACRMHVYANVNEHHRVPTKRNTPPLPYFTFRFKSSVRPVSLKPYIYTHVISIFLREDDDPSRSRTLEKKQTFFSSSMQLHFVNIVNPLSASLYTSDSFIRLSLILDSGISERRFILLYIYTFFFFFFFDLFVLFYFMLYIFFVNFFFFFFFF